MTNPLVEVYARKDCSLCDIKGCSLCGDALSTVERIKGEVPFAFREVDIDSSEDLMRRFTGDIPTIFLNGKKVFKYKVDEAEFRKKVRKEVIKAGLSRLSSKKDKEQYR